LAVTRTVRGSHPIKGKHMTKDEEISLKALQYAASLGNGRIVREMNTAPFIIRCDEALEQPEQEPVDFASLLREAEEIVQSKPTWKRFIDGTPLANDIAVWMAVFSQDVARRTSPPQRPWVGLTKEEIDSALSKYQNWYEFAAHLENILKEKNQ